MSGETTTKLRGSIADLIGDLSFNNFKYFSGEQHIILINLLLNKNKQGQEVLWNINSPDANRNNYWFNFLQLDILETRFSSYKNFKSTDYTYSDVSFNLNLKPKFASVLNSK